MKLQKLVIIMMILSAQNCFAMDDPKIGWSDLPATVVSQIIAQLPDKQILVLVDKKFSQRASKKNTDTLLQWPCVLSRKHHIECMVKYANEDNIGKMQRALASASLCDHDDAVEIISYFYPEGAHELSVLADYQSNPTQETLEKLLPHIMAVYKGSDELHKKYKNKYEVYLQVRSRIQPLLWAVLKDHRSVAELLLTQVESCAQKTIASKHCSFAVAVATMCNSLEMVKILLRYPCIDINAKDFDGCSAIMYAASEGYREIVQYLIDKGANVDITMQDSLATPLHAIAGNGKHDILTMLLAAHPIIDPVDSDNKTPLYIAVSNGKHKIVNLLLNAGADPNISGGIKKATPLMKSVKHVTFGIMTYLLNAGALVDAQNVLGATALRYVVEKDLDLDNPMKLLFKHNANPNIADIFGVTPLHVAVDKGNINIVSFLLQKGALIDVQNKEGETPLMLAVHNSNALVLRTNKKQTNIVYLSPRFAVIQLLLEAKADPNKVDAKGNTALMLAVRGDNFAVVDLLLQFKADPRIKNLKGKKAADLAMSSEMKKRLKDSNKRFKDSNNCIVS